MAYGHIHTLRHAATVSTAITVLQLKAGATSPFRILRLWATEYGSATAAQARLALVRKTVAATVTTAVVGTHLFKHRPGDPTPDLSLGTSATGVIASGEGTDGDILQAWGFNVVNGLEVIYNPMAPSECIHVPAAGIIGLKFTTAPGSQTWEFGITVEELG